MGSISRILFCIVFAVAALARANGDLSVREISRESARHLRPTQGALGLHSTREDREEFEKMSKDKRWEELAERPIRVVIGPGGELYIIDGHHMVRALLDSDHHKLYVKVVADWSRISEEIFWARMKKHNYVWLFDERGRPIDPKDLPRYVQDMKDDPYRSLAKYAREKGAYRDTATLYAEFYWANYYRQHISVRKLNELGWKDATKLAGELSRLPGASGLPGYKGPRFCRRVLL